jgi:signal transduction histidine kinase
MHKNAIEILHLKESQQNELFQAISNTEARENERIATNLHDEIGMTLNLIKQNMSRLKRELVPDSSDFEIVHQNNQMLDSVIDSLYTCVYELVPKFMLDYGLSKSLMNDMLQIRSSKNIDTSFSCPDNFVFENYYDKNQLIHINRLCHEIFNNILKHSTCNSLSFQIIPKRSNITLSIIHNGKPISTAEINVLSQSSKGLGLKSIKARVLILNATLKYEDDNGFASIILILPHNSINQNAETNSDSFS